MLWEKKVAQWSASVRAQLNLPARLVLWDGKSYDFGTFGGPAVSMHVKSPSALGLLLNPSLDNLGEAYVKNKIDLEGKVNDIIEIAYMLAGSSLGTSDKLQRVARYFTHTKTSDKKSIEYHYGNSPLKAVVDGRVLYGVMSATCWSRPKPTRQARPSQ